MTPKFKILEFFYPKTKRLFLQNFKYFITNNFQQALNQVIKLVINKKNL